MQRRTARSETLLLPCTSASCPPAAPHCAAPWAAHIDGAGQVVIWAAASSAPEWQLVKPGMQTAKPTEPPIPTSPPTMLLLLTRSAKVSMMVSNRPTDSFLSQPLTFQRRKALGPYTCSDHYNEVGEHPFEWPSGAQAVSLACVQAGQRQHCTVTFAAQHATCHLPRAQTPACPQTGGAARRPGWRRGRQDAEHWLGKLWPATGW